MVRRWGNGFLGKEQRHALRNEEEELSNLGQNEVMARHMRKYWAAYMDCPCPFPRSEGARLPGLEEWKILGLCFQG